jgi:hypothetical protein
MKLFSYVKNLFQLSISCILVFGLATSALSVAHAGLVLSDEQKMIFSRPVVKRVGLDIEFDSVKNNYAVNESIKFKVKGNKKFFLYVFNIDRKNNKAVMILPNDLQSGNKYSANNWYNVPNANIEFYSDSAGIEEVVIVASSKWIDFDTKSYKKIGKFMFGDLAPVDKQLKILRIRPRPSQTDNVENSDEVVVRDLAILITGKSEETVTGTGTTLTDPAPAPIASPLTLTNTDIIPFVSTNKMKYRLGEKVKMVFGADVAGWIHLYTQEPDDALTLLKSQKVDGSSIYKTEGYTQGMYGEHKLIAVYTKDKTFDVSTLNKHINDKTTKRVSILPSKPITEVDDTVVNFSIRRFKVIR